MDNYPIHPMYAGCFTVYNEKSHYCIGYMSSFSHIIYWLAEVSNFEEDIPVITPILNVNAELLNDIRELQYEKSIQRHIFIRW